MHTTGLYLSQSLFSRGNYLIGLPIVRVRAQLCLMLTRLEGVIYVLYRSGPALNGTQHFLTDLCDVDATCHYFMFQVWQQCRASSQPESARSSPPAPPPLA